MINKRIAKSDKLAALAKDRHRLMYFMIYPHLDRDGRYSADRRDIQEDCCPRLGYKLHEISESLQALNDVGLISLYSINEKQYLEASRFDDFQVGLHKEREAPSEIPPNPSQSPDNSGKCRKDAEEVPLNVKFKVKFKVKVNNAELRSAVIAYLNEKAGKHFSSKSDQAIRHIQARIAEGRTLDDFRRVIDVKVSEWRGDPKMDKFLRPETLFGTKMESYLNERIIAPKLTAAEHERNVGEAGRDMDAEFSPEARKFLPQIDKEFDDGNLIEKGTTRTEYRRSRMTEIFAGRKGAKP